MWAVNDSRPTFNCLVDDSEYWTVGLLYCEGCGCVYPVSDTQNISQPSQLFASASAYEFLKGKVGMSNSLSAQYNMYWNSAEMKVLVHSRPPCRTDLADCLLVDKYIPTHKLYACMSAVAVVSIGSMHT